MTETLPPVLYQGSVKNVRGDAGVATCLFEFSDRYSIFDWGPMPDTLAGKGAALAWMAWFFFDWLGNPETWRGWDAPGALRSSPLPALLRAEGMAHHARSLTRTDLLEVKRVRVIPPGPGNDYAAYRARPENALVPLEVIFRFGVPQGSSLLKRAGDAAYCRAIGLETPPRAGDVFALPVIEFSTKLESTDRYVDYDAAREIAGLSTAEFETLRDLARLAALRLKDCFAGIGVELWDGKLEFAFTAAGADGARGFMLVDSIGPDELRLIRGGVHLSKEMLRGFYRDSPWHAALPQAQAMAAERGTEDWQRICAEELQCLPGPLTPAARQQAEDVYTGLRDALSGKYGATVLLLGGGGREHALAWKLSASPRVARIVALPGGDGMAALPKVSCIPGDASDVARVVEAARAVAPRLVIVGPEKPLAAGVADALAAAGFAVLGPCAAAAQIESSKIFAKEFMREAGIPTAPFEVCDSYAAAEKALAARDVAGRGVVVKADGLAAGKGVVVTHDPAAALRAARDFMLDPSCAVKTDRLLIEEILEGREVSAFALCDGEAFVPLGFACDYKRVRDGDQGPNTGGMGGYAPRGWPSEKARRFVHDEIFARAVAGMKRRGTPYRGILFAGLMVDGDSVSVIEFNARFGDPEAQILLPLVDGDIFPLFESAAHGCLSGAAAVRFRDETAVHVVMASAGYPEIHGGGAAAGEDITLPESLLAAGSNDNGLLFISGARKTEDGWVSAGGRVLGVTAVGGTVAEAAGRAYDAIGGIHFNGAHWRKDIGR